MSTSAQVAANRANSQLSTGPRSAEGKTASSQNAATHGLYSHNPELQGDAAEFERILADYRAEFHPEGAVESELVRQLAVSSIKLRRIDELLDIALLEIDPSSIAASLRTYERLHSIHRYWDRLYFRALHELERIARMRAGEFVPPPKVTEIVHVSARRPQSSSDLSPTNTQQTGNDPIGFVSPNPMSGPPDLLSQYPDLLAGRAR
jgi:hypothetical protein